MMQSENEEEFMRKYRVGIVGCGTISRAHINAYRSMKDCCVVLNTDIP
jgi:predicted dehydrogenase